ncbi:MAG: hypothetical protein FJX47_05090 [Alphaproteobacteria bacterium]|nr:hypothetical protein [Alphaproteobacteria bacterium]
MLDAIRKHATGWVVKIFLSILILSFALWGIPEIFRRSTPQVVAVVGGQDIGADQFQAEFRRALQRLQAAMGGQIDAERAKLLGIGESTLQSMVSSLVLDRAVDRLGLAISPAVVQKSIIANPAFRGPRGEFDRAVYEGRVRAMGLGAASYEYELRRALAQEALIGSFEGFANAPKMTVDLLYRHREERRVAELVFIPDDTMPAPPAPDEATLAAFHKDNAARFSAPEYRKLAVLRLRAEDLAGEIRVTEDDLKEEFESRADEFSFPERREIEQVLFDDPAKAKAAADKIAAGGDLAEIAKEATGRTPDELGVLAQSDLPEELAQAAFALGTGTVSAPIATPFGWHLLRVRTVQPARKLSFADARATLLDDLKLRRAADNLALLANRVEDRLAAGTPVRESAHQLALRIEEIEAVDARGRDPEDKDVALDRAVLEAAFAVIGTGDTRLIETQDGGYAVAQIERVTPSALKPLDKVRAEVVAAWNADRKSAAALALAEDTAAKAGAGGDLAAIAKGIGRDFRISAPIRRGGATGDSTVSSALAGRLFEIEIGKTVTAASVAGDGMVVARLKSIEAAKPEEDAAGLDRMNRQLAEAVNADLVQLAQQAMRDAIGVKIYPQVLDKAY